MKKEGNFQRENWLLPSVFINCIIFGKWKDPDRRYLNSYKSLTETFTTFINAIYESVNVFTAYFRVLEFVFAVFRSRPKEQTYKILFDLMKTKRGGYGLLEKLHYNKSSPNPFFFFLFYLKTHKKYTVNCIGLPFFRL